MKSSTNSINLQKLNKIIDKYMVKVITKIEFLTFIVYSLVYVM